MSSFSNDVRMTMFLWMQIFIMRILHTTTISNVLSNVLDLCVVFVTPSLQRSLSSRNQSIDLQSKSIDCFLYDRTSVMKELISNSCRFGTKDFLPDKITVFLYIYPPLGYPNSYFNHKWLIFVLRWMNLHLLKKVETLFHLYL